MQLPTKESTDAVRISLLHRMRDILLGFFVNIVNVVFFWLPGGDPAYGYILLAVQTLCYALVAALFVALPFIRLCLAAFNLVVLLGRWIWTGCSISFLRDALGKVGGTLVSPFYRLFELLTGRGDPFRVSEDGAHVPVTMEDTLAKYGAWTIQSVKIRREPLCSLMNKGLNLITLGNWSSAVKTLPIENFYHLALILRIRSAANEECVIVLEKNALVRMSDLFETNEQQEFHEIRHFPKIALNTFIKKAYESMNECFFPFDAFHNNCQDFILGILVANVKLTKSAKDFIMQPVAKLLEQLPPHTSSLANIIAQFGAVLDIAIHNDI